MKKIHRHIYLGHGRARAATWSIDMPLHLEAVIARRWAVMGSRESEAIGFSTPVNGQVIDPELGQKFQETDVIMGLRGLADVAQDKLSSPGSILSPSEIDRQLRSESRDALSSDEQLAMAEMNVLLAKYGQTPANSVEGLIKLRKMLTQIYKDNSIVPAETKRELAVLERNLAVVEQTRELFITRRITEERTKGNKAFISSLKSEWDINAVESRLDVQRIEKQGVIDTAHTQALESKVINTKKTGLLNNDYSIIDKVVDNDRLEKTIDAHKKTASIVWMKVARPFLKPAIKVAVVILLVGIVFSFFVETSKTPMYPLLSPFNDIRHLILDPVWITLTTAIESASKPK
ncbi:hypothetical protein [Paenarthrobacter aurescens]|uniref:hypothetical protein n=1 Tax=Paenarthrobacter aurescens TaxID=43663 RepID=UPI001144A6F0|nr:hypothetical protein [Paenarthrobacter aurescens]MDO6158457.1 hypothetical protein [Paenarthrobacter aurescens]MDO6162441.1 hypothetical protein [Paenarthrobacter aurescens]